MLSFKTFICENEYTRSSDSTVHHHFNVGKHKVHVYYTKRTGHKKYNVDFSVNNSMTRLPDLNPLEGNKILRAVHSSVRGFINTYNPSSLEATISGSSKKKSVFLRQLDKLQRV